MKKYFLVVFCALLLFVVTGCGGKKVTCSQTTTEAGVEMKAEVIADLDDNDKITGATVVYDMGDKTTADQYCSLMKMAEDKEKGVTVECSGSKITIKGMASLDEGEDESMIGKTKDEFVKEAEKEGFTCK